MSQTRSCFRLQHRPSHLSLSLLLFLTPFFFQWLQAPLADASVRLPPLVAQATQALQDVTNPTHLPWPIAAESSVRLPPTATQAHTSQSFPPAVLFSRPSPPGPSNPT